MRNASGLSIGVRSLSLVIVGGAIPSPSRRTSCGSRVGRGFARPTCGALDPPLTGKLVNEGNGAERSYRFDQDHRRHSPHGDALPWP
jgi:hypothetical protein